MKTVIFAHDGFICAQSNPWTDSVENTPMDNGFTVCKAENVEITQEALDLIKNAPRANGKGAQMSLQIQDAVNPMIAMLKGEDPDNLPKVHLVMLGGMWNHIADPSHDLMSEKDDISVLDKATIIEKFDTPEVFIAGVERIKNNENDCECPDCVARQESKTKDLD